MSRRRLLVLVLTGAIALTASYPPFPLPPLSFLAITPVVAARWDVIGGKSLRFTLHPGLTFQDGSPENPW